MGLPGGHLPPEGEARHVYNLDMYGTAHIRGTKQSRPRYQSFPKPLSYFRLSSKTRCTTEMR